MSFVRTKFQSHGRSGLCTGEDQIHSTSLSETWLLQGEQRLSAYASEGGKLRLQLNEPLTVQNSFDSSVQCRIQGVKGYGLVQEELQQTSHTQQYATPVTAAHQASSK